MPSGPEGASNQLGDLGNFSAHLPGGPHETMHVEPWDRKGRDGEEGTDSEVIESFHYLSTLGPPYSSVKYSESFRVSLGLRFLPWAWTAICQL